MRPGCRLSAGSARRTGGARAGGLLLGVLLFASGCATHSLNGVRRDFYAGRLDAAGAALESMRVPSRDRLLFLLERGTVEQARGAYAESARNFIQAADVVEELETYSLSRGGASFVVNDNVQEFKAAPFERTLLHAFAAQSHLALGHWENAAVEARRIIHELTPDRLGKYPADAYSRYVAGFCLELTDDPSNAALQYREADALAGWLRVDESNGRLSPAGEGTAPPEPAAAWAPGAEGGEARELVCFFLAGRTPGGSDLFASVWPGSSRVYADLYAGGRYLGRGHTLADTAALAFTNEQLQNARKTAKALARIALKEGIATAVEQNDELMGALVRFVLIGLLEQPDVRRWETLPRWLGVARVPCPPDLAEFDVVLRNQAGTELKRVRVTEPLQKRGRVFVSLCRDVAR
ncbi:MAG: hypothetical protein FJ225_12075 [Lentisphaerae bacterium]|nr:hypothetical protein [Lentisphaerota bacterium]